MFHLDRIQQRLFIIMGIIIVILASLLIYLAYLSDDAEAEVLSQSPPPIESQPPADNKTAEPINEADKNETKKIKIYIVGAVKEAGLIELNEDDRLYDAVIKAGGPDEDADLTRVNLAIRVKDEGMYYIPRQGEDISQEISPIMQNPQNTAKEPDQSEDNRVNLNTASQSILETLPNIGPKRAESIIRYREENGPFSRIEDIKKISGIGDKIYDSLKDYISVD